MRLLEFAHKLSHSSLFPQKSFRMAAVVAKGSAVLSVGVNSYVRHAEARAVRPHRDFEGVTVYVARTNGLMSKPCPRCLRVLQRAGVRYMVYHDWAGTVTKERV